MKALIDADPFAYAVACACEGTSYQYIDGRNWKYKNVATSTLKDEGLDLSLLVKVSNPESVGTVEKTLEAYVDERLERAGSFDCELFLTDSSTVFRNKVATIKPYKGQRPEEKPTHLAFVRKMLIEKYDATLCNRYEADDALGISWTPEHVLVHVDKDINMIPGYHLNPETSECYEVTPTEGIRHFYTQLLTGDPSDNILGIYGIGAKSTHVTKLLSMSNEEDMYSHVLNIYSSYFGSYAKKFFYENCKLLWILRNPMYYEAPFWMKEGGIANNYWEE